MTIFCITLAENFGFGEKYLYEKCLHKPTRYMFTEPIDM